MDEKYTLTDEVVQSILPKPIWEASKELDMPRSDWNAADSAVFERMQIFDYVRNLDIVYDMIWPVKCMICYDESNKHNRD